jgi:hypothetical protein
MRELVRHIQNHRKKAGLSVEDRIHLGITSSGEIVEVLDKYQSTITNEVLAKDVNETEEFDYTKDIEVNNISVQLGITKV